MDSKEEILKLNAIVKRCDEDCLKYNQLVNQLEKEKKKLLFDNIFYRE